MKKITRLLALAGLVVAAVSFAAAPAGAGTSYTYSNDLRWWVHNALESASMTETHAKSVPLPVEVRCYTDAYSFAVGAYRRGIAPRQIPYIIAYYNGGNSIHMRAETCKEAERFTQGVYTAASVGAFSTLLHEALHRQGFRDEHTTEQYALAAMADAGRLVQYNVYIANGASDEDAAYDATASTGDKVQQIAWHQSVRVVAPVYRTTWSEVESAARQGWAARLGL
jgi:hypothetical protein